MLLCILVRATFLLLALTSTDTCAIVSSPNGSYGVLPLSLSSRRRRVLPRSRLIHNRLCRKERIHEDVDGLGRQQISKKAETPGTEAEDPLGRLRAPVYGW